MLASTLSGCLITEDIAFEEQEDFPPAFVFRSSSPRIGQTLTIDTDGFMDGDNNLTFALDVRDENVGQPLETQIRLRTQSGPVFSELRLLDTDGPAVAASGRVERSVQFSFLSSLLLKGHCHQLEFAVSGEFLDAADDERIFAFPVNDGDVAVATWWLWETSSPVDLETCPTDAF